VSGRAPANSRVGLVTARRQLQARVVTFSTNLDGGADASLEGSARDGNPRGVIGVVALAGKRQAGGHEGGGGIRSNIKGAPCRPHSGPRFKKGLGSRERPSSQLLAQRLLLARPKLEGARIKVRLAVGSGSRRTELGSTNGPCAPAGIRSLAFSRFLAPLKEGSRANQGLRKVTDSEDAGCLRVLAVRRT
jgi:hypothetical protein